MKSIWMVALLGLVLLVPLASAGDVASSEASGQLGVGVEDNEDEGDQGLKTLTAESQEDSLPVHYTIFVIAMGIAAALALTLLLFYVVIRLYYGL